ncbi:MAG: hypothetical protein MJZ00_08130 [Paludibacteraceae bacterium]|nr:hypothetical protein [Paludibacteraceae bacterium]
MKKNFFYALGMAALLCGCDSGTVEENGNRMAAYGFVSGFGNVTTTFSYYDFTVEEPDCEIYGFSGLEDFGRWTSGDSVSFKFEGVSPNSNLTAKIDFCMIGPSGNTPLKYDAYANDVKICSNEAYSGTKSTYINIPANVIGDKEDLYLYLYMKNPVRPMDENPNVYDSRPLGLAVTGVSLYGFSVEED